MLKAEYQKNTLLEPCHLSVWWRMKVRKLSDTQSLSFIIVLTEAETENGVDISSTLSHSPSSTEIGKKGLGYVNAGSCKLGPFVLRNSVPSVGVNEGLSVVIFCGIWRGKSLNLALPWLQHSVCISLCRPLQYRQEACSRVGSLFFTQLSKHYFAVLIKS